MPQQRSDQHHPPGTPTMMHPATAAGPPIVAPSPAYSAQYFTCSPQQFTNQPLVQQMTHYQSQVRVFHSVRAGFRTVARSGSPWEFCLQKWTELYRLLWCRSLMSPPADSRLMMWLEGVFLRFWNAELMIDYHLFTKHVGEHTVWVSPECQCYIDLQ